jgi:hypothetical protein|tara:strand:+ start:339 stop:1499 length:1161 start_codon:yes stop_codon:yes gene_type:complete
MARNRVIYQSEGLYVSKNASLTGSADHEQLNRVQSANYNFSINRQDVNQFGDLARIDSLVLDAPTVSLDFSYYLTDGFNERSLGFFVQTTGNGMMISGAGTAGGEANFASGHLLGSSGQNFYIVTSPDGQDLNSTGDGTKLIATDTTIGVGNCYLSDYSVDLSVGSLPTVSITVEGANMNSSTTAASGQIPSPAINQESGTKYDHKVVLPNATEDGGITGKKGDPAITALRPGDVTLSLGDIDGVSLVKLDGSDGAHIQSASISLPLSRTPIDRLGSRFPFAREVDFPVIATMNISAIVATTQSANLADLLNSGVESASISVNDTSGNAAIKYTMKGLKVDSQSFSSSIGSNKSVDITFSTQVGGPADQNNGVFMSGINGTNRVFV